MIDALKAARDALLEAEAALDAVYDAACRSEIVVRDVATTCGGGTYGLWDRADRAADECGLAIAAADAALAVVADERSPLLPCSTTQADVLTLAGEQFSAYERGHWYSPSFVARYARLGSHADVEDAARDVLAERRRQVEAEGWTPEHDDEHGDGSLAWAAVCYAMPEPHRFGGCYWRMERPGPAIPPVAWPDSWHVRWWKPKDRRSDLVRAAAMLLAEIERLDRARKEQT